LIFISANKVILNFMRETKLLVHKLPVRDPWPLDLCIKFVTPESNWFQQLKSEIGWWQQRRRDTWHIQKNRTWSEKTTEKLGDGLTPIKSPFPSQHSFLAFKDNTVKPVYNGYPWDPKIVTFVDRWSSFRYPLSNESSRWNL